MDIFWILLAIPIGVYVLFALARGAMGGATQAAEEETAQRAEPVRRPQAGPTDVERFLAEVNRRRREAEGEENPAPPPPPSMPTRRQPEPKPQVRVKRRVSEEQARKLPAVVLAEPAAPVVLEPLNFPRAQAPRSGTRGSPAVAEVLKMLRSPQSVAKAILLQEILGPPRCKRRPGR
jgi:hypothetical protein